MHNKVMYVNLILFVFFKYEIIRMETTRSIQQNVVTLASW